MKYKAPRGTYDILPSQSWKWQRMTEVFRQTAALYGFQEIVTPIFEQSDLFERSSGESSDIVQKEMYRFSDRKGRSLALRPEGTAPVVRSYCEHHLDARGGITRLYYIGAMFRYDRPQAGRYRQFYQYGVELIGSHHPYYDAEIIAFECAFLHQLGLSGFELHINSVGCPACFEEYENALIHYFTPHLDNLCEDCAQRLAKNPRRILDCKVPRCRELSHSAPVILDYLDEDCRQHFSAVQSYLESMDISYTVDTRIVRGLDYYTHTAFEFICPSLGAQDTIAGGGRYNGLIEQVGGRAIPAIGIAGGFERLLLALEDQEADLGGMPTPEITLVTLGEAAVKAAPKLISLLRRSSHSVIWDPEKTSLKAALKSADANQSRYAYIIGDDEITRKKITRKELSTGIQDEIALND